MNGRKGKKIIKGTKRKEIYVKQCRTRKAEHDMVGRESNGLRNEERSVRNERNGRNGMKDTE
jgi:hypothetical protein